MSDSEGDSDLPEFNPLDYQNYRFSFDAASPNDFHDNNFDHVNWFKNRNSMSLMSENGEDFLNDEDKENQNIDLNDAKENINAEIFTNVEDEVHHIDEEERLEIEKLITDNESEEIKLDEDIEVKPMDSSDDTIQPHIGSSKSVSSESEPEIKSPISMSPVKKEIKSGLIRRAPLTEAPKRLLPKKLEPKTPFVMTTQILPKMVPLTEASKRNIIKKPETQTQTLQRFPLTVIKETNKIKSATMPINRGNNSKYQPTKTIPVSPLLHTKRRAAEKLTKKLELQSSSSHQSEQIGSTGRAQGPVKNLRPLWK